MTEPFRPKLHFSPQKGWMNDPNGMIRVDGVYHLFFQHDPDSTLHGPMHWGHAQSHDLVSWEELPVALYPTDLGTCFSGSAIQTNTGEVKLFYTAHRRFDDDYQIQCLVHASRDLTAYRAEPGNPVLDNPGLVCFRDPKVIWYAPTERWIMAITHGQSIGFYSSTDLQHWTPESRFGEGHGRHSDGPWECPDLFPLRAPNGTEHWVLVVGIGSGSYASGSGTQYFIGQFDGHRFTNANEPQTTLWMDYGRDFYAAQSFFDRDGEAPVAIGWASNWEYARQTPTKAFRGVMSLPRELSLAQTRNGLRLAQHLPATVREAYGPATDDHPSGTYHRAIKLDLSPGEQATIRLFGESDLFSVTRNETQATLRSSRGPFDGMPSFAHDYDVVIDYPTEGPLALDLYVDRGLVELATRDGLTWMTQLFFPTD